MNIYYVVRKRPAGWDEFVAFVCIASSEAAAAFTHPRGTHIYWDEDEEEWREADGDNYHDRTWVPPHAVSVRLLGKAGRGDEPEVVLSDFNNG